MAAVLELHAIAMATIADLMDDSGTHVFHIQTARF